ncbi:Methyl sulfide methyltransferase-associated sensor [uncultured archaeon]|nr:Methyl sulfide methyltransferase-associated sensor [uncultured archaeon]
MKKDTQKSDRFNILRERVKELLRKQPEDRQGLYAEDLENLIQELQMHQIELEMQNEALSRAHDELGIKVKERTEELIKAEELNDTLNGVNAAINSTLDFDEIMRRVVIEAAHAIGCETAAISLRKSDLWIVSYVYGFPEELIGKQMNDDEERHAVIAIESKKPVVINDAYNDERVNFEHMKKYGIRSVLVAPLLAGNETIGVIFLNHHSAAITFSDSHVDFVKKLAVSLSLAIEKARMYKEEKQANEINRFQATILSQVNDAVIAVDNGNRIIYWNSGAERLYDLKNEEVVGRDVKELQYFIWPNVLEGKAAYASLSATGEWRGECIHAKKSGEEMYVDISASVLRNENGIKVGLLGIVRDITGRKKIEEALQKSEQKYRGLFDNASDAIITLDLDDNITSWNRSAERIFGWTAQEAAGKKLVDLTIPQDKLVERNQILLDVLSGNNISGFETTRRCKDGSLVEVSLTFSPIANANGDIIGLSGIVRDITERKNIEKERERLITEILRRQKQTENLALLIKKERDTLNIIMENTETHLAYLDSKFNIIRVNSAYAKGSGHKKEELAGRNHFDLFPGPENQAVFENIRDTGKTMEFRAKPFEFADQPWRGVTYWDLTLSPLKNERGKVDRLVLSLMEVTDRIKLEQTIQKALAYAESIIDAIQSPFLILDANLHVVKANHAFYKIFKVPIEEIKNKLIYDLGNGQWNIPKLRELLEEIIPSNNLIEDFEVEQAFPGIGRKTMLLNARRIYRDTLDKQMILLVIEDITERKKMDELRIENERLISASKARSEFLSIMSHELRTPLTSIIGYSILMQELRHGKLNEKQKFYVDSIHTNSKHLLSLINSILDLAKLESGKLDLVIEDVSVKYTVNEILGLMKEKAASRNVIFKKEFGANLPVIKADRQKLKQILFNLLSNAIKFSKDEGGIVTVSAKKRDDFMRISVSDTGIGIREEDMPRLFQKFEQLDSGASRKYEGTGLGLAITKELVEMHGGKIWVESRYGDGTSFIFLLPVASKNEN